MDDIDKEILRKYFRFLEAMVPIRRKTMHFQSLKKDIKNGLEIASMIKI